MMYRRFGARKVRLSSKEHNFKMGCFSSKETGKLIAIRGIIKSIDYMCENTHLCSSLHKLLNPRRELMCGRIEREAGS